MLCLPQEIWLHVANFIKPSALEDLIGLNSTFYDLAMDCRYRQISFAYLDKKMMKNMVRLRDPVVAKRVRVLHIYPTFLNQILNNERLERKPNYARKPSRLRNIRDLAHHFIERRIFVGRKKIRLNPKLRTPEDIIKSMLKVFSGLPNVIDYRIMWCGLPSIPVSPAPLLAALFRPDLRKLSLDISLENVPKLFTDPTSTQSLANIEELNLLIRLDHCVDPSVLSSIMINHLAPLISRLRNTLRQLSIHTWEPLDLFPFFCALHFLPHLEHLTIGFPVAYPHLGNPRGVSTFLQCQSSTLRSLCLRATANNGPECCPDSFPINSWIPRALKDVHLQNLRDLSISTPLFPFSATLTCLERLSATITSLSLTGRYFQHADVVAVLDAFKDRLPEQRLESLHLGVVALTPQLLDLLAQELPNLCRLDLLIRKLAPNNDNDDGLPTFPGDRTNRLDNFFCEMEKRRYYHWHLSCFKYTLTSFPYHFPFRPLQQLLRHSIPTIRGFS